jgi:aldehyde dehydrogenase (NAD+)
MSTVPEQTTDDAVIVHRDIYVDGEWVPSDGTNLIDVVNPYTEKVIGQVVEGTASDVDRAVNAAVAAYPAWSNTPINERQAALRRLADLIEENEPEITAGIIREIGAPIIFAVDSQTKVAVSDLRNFADALDQVTWIERVDNFAVRRQPVGVIGAITAWNGPLRSIVLKVGAAIAVGCTVVLKPTEVAPLNAYVFMELAEKAGIPAGVINLVSGRGPEVGEAISAHPLIDGVTLTGSVRAGRAVMKTASETVKRLALELGGKSANVVLEDADLQAAISGGLDDAFRNSGQVCGGLSRTLVPRSLLAEAEEFAVAKAESFVLGDPFDPGTTMGPVANVNQLNRIRNYIRIGQEENARMLTGGAESPDGLETGFFVKPTVFSGTNDLRIAQEEIFGPVNVIIPFDDEADAVRIANDVNYGLGGAVWSADPDRAREVASRIRTGRVRINGTPINMRAPHGGFKLSGIGREMGRYGLEEFLEYQSVIG